MTKSELQKELEESLRSIKWFEENKSLIDGENRRIRDETNELQKRLNFYESIIQLTKNKKKEKKP